MGRRSLAASQRHRSDAFVLALVPFWPGERSHLDGDSFGGPRCAGKEPGAQSGPPQPAGRVSRDRGGCPTQATRGRLLRVGTGRQTEPVCNVDLVTPSEMVTCLRAVGFEGNDDALWTLTVEGLTCEGE